MSVMLPAALSEFLNMVGFEWPEGDEDKIFDWSRRWMAYAEDVDGSAQLAHQAADYASEHNVTAAMEAFRTDFTKADGVAEVAHKLGTAGNVLGGCLVVVGAAVIVLKCVFVVNLISLAIQIAEAIAAAAATFGASLAWIPVAREIARRLIEYGINLAVTKLMGG